MVEVGGDVDQPVAVPITDNHTITWLEVVGPSPFFPQLLLVLQKATSLSVLPDFPYNWLPGGKSLASSRTTSPDLPISGSMAALFSRTLGKPVDLTALESQCQHLVPPLDWLVLDVIFEAVVALERDHLFVNRQVGLEVHKFCELAGDEIKHSPDLVQSVVTWTDFREQAAAHCLKSAEGGGSPETCHVSWCQQWQQCCGLEPSTFSCLAGGKQTCRGISVRTASSPTQELAVSFQIVPGAFCWSPRQSASRCPAQTEQWSSPHHGWYDPGLNKKQFMCNVQSRCTTVTTFFFFFFFPYIFLGIFVYMYLCRPSEASTRYCVIPGGYPPQDWQSLPCAGEELDSNSGLLICSQVCYHWATSPPNIEPPLLLSLSHLSSCDYCTYMQNPVPIMHLPSV